MTKVSGERANTEDAFANGVRWRGLAIVAAFGFLTWWRLSFPLDVAFIFLWPTFLFTSFVPGINIGSPEEPMYEATIAHFAAAVVSAPFVLGYWGFLLLQLGRVLKRQDGRYQSMMR